MTSFKDLNIEVAINSRISTVMLFKITNTMGNSRKNTLEIMVQLLYEPVSSPLAMISLETALQCKILVDVWGGEPDPDLGGKHSEGKILHC